MSVRGVLAGVFLALALAGFACTTERAARVTPPKSAKAAFPRAPPPQPPLPREDETGTVGAPLDETAFDFDTEPSAKPAAPVVEIPGEPAPLEALEDRLAPYLQARRATLASVGPEGKRLLVLTRLGETTHVHEVRKPGGARRQVTFGSEPVTQASYVPGVNDVITYRADRGGDEQHQIYRLELSPRRHRRISDGKSRHGVFVWSPAGDALAYTSNARSERDLDVLLGDGASGESARVVMAGEGSWSVIGFSAERRSLLLRNFRSVIDAPLYVLSLDSGERRPLIEAEDSAMIACSAAVYGPSDGTFIAACALEDDDVTQLYRVDARAKSVSPLLPKGAHDVEEVTLSPDRRTLAFTTNEDGVSRMWTFALDKSAAPRAVPLPEGVVTGLRFARGAEVLAFTLATPTDPGDAYTYNLASKKLSRWTRSEVGGLVSSSFIAPERVRIKSFDDVEVPSLLYRPEGPGPHPVLLWIHGGPEEQTRASFHPIIQFFVVELGIAVLAPNVRGSSGYGRHYLSLDDGRKRMDAVRDIGAVLDFVEEDAALDAARVGIHGASYGGFMVLASLVEHGERLRAGSDLVGVSHFVSFLERTREYRRDLRRAEYGDERDPEMRAFLDSISPLTNASRISRPLFVAHGVNDPRVPWTEAEQIADAVRENGVEVWTMFAPDEGHGFAKQHNRDRFYRLLASFFETHLRAEEPASTEAAPDEPLD